MNLFLNPFQLLPRPVELLFDTSELGFFGFDNGLLAVYLAGELLHFLGLGSHGGVGRVEVGGHGRIGTRLAAGKSQGAGKQREGKKGSTDYYGKN